jgi:hypothetical protein
MREHLVNLSEAETNVLAGAVYLAENIKSSDGFADSLKEIVPRYLERKDVDFAARLADSIDDPHVRDRLLSDVAEKCAEFEDDEYALQLADAIEDYNYQALARERISAQKAARGEFDKALEIAETLPHPSDALAEIAVNQAIKGDEAAALETILRIEHHASKVNALLQIAAHYQGKEAKEKAAELLSLAFDEARLIEHREEKIRALLSVAELFIANAQPDKAIEILAETKIIASALESRHRDAFLTLISLDFLRAGSIDLADLTLDLVEDKTQIASCLAGFATVFDEKGERADALETLEEAYAILKSQTDREIRDSRARYGVFSAIAARFALLEEPERAIDIALENPIEEERHLALSQIARICASKDKDDSARQALNAIEEESARVFALIALSDTKNKSEKREEAIQYLNEAENFCESVPQLPSRSQAYNELAARFYDYGDTEKARRLLTESFRSVSRILDESHKAVALANLSAMYEKFEFQLNEQEKEFLREMVLRSDL